MNKPATAPVNHARRPEWLKVRIPLGTRFAEVRSIVERNRLNTVCEDARCPNMGECWNRGTATFMILGETCTRSCGFCAVRTGRPAGLDPEEPERIASAVKEMGLRHAVITSVNRDDLKDGGAVMFAETIRRIRLEVPLCTIEVLIPDFKGDPDALATIIKARPDILNHNIETVPRLYPLVRSQAKYHRSLFVLNTCKSEGLLTKSGIMLGIGETEEEITGVLRDLRAAKVDIVTLGQYLQPSKAHHPVDRFVTPDEFLRWKTAGLKLGFTHVESGPLVRSSYHAENHIG